MRTLAFSLATLALLLVAAAPAAAGKGDRSDVYRVADGTVVMGAWSELDRDRDSVRFKFRTAELEGGHAYSAWAVFFNRPAMCSAPGCGEDDVFLPDGSLNMVQIAAARISAVWSGSGKVARRDGRAQFVGKIREGDPPGQVLFGPGLESAADAEVHFVIRDHGPASADRETRESQLTTFEGNCDVYACMDVQFSVHLPG